MDDVLYCTGYPDNRPLIAGLYTMKDTLGFPLDISVMICREKGWNIDWCEFIADAGRHGAAKFLDAISEMEIINVPNLTEIQCKFFALLKLTPGEDTDEQCKHIYDEKRRTAKALHDLTEKILKSNDPSTSV